MTLASQIMANIGQKTKLHIYNIKRRKSRGTVALKTPEQHLALMLDSEAYITPRRGWGGLGVLGLLICTELVQVLSCN